MSGDVDFCSGTGSSAYAQHLAAVNERHRVRASNDVFSVHGVLIAKRGAVIDYETARKIVRHKLTMPLDKSVVLENALSKTGLLRRLTPTLEKFTDLRTLHESAAFGAAYERVATKLDLPGLVAQKLTVMGLRQPTLMDQAVLGAWFACLVGQELGLEEKELALLHLAAASRDLGMLHVDPALLARPVTHIFGADDWLAVQSHAVASHMILKECEGLPERLLDAVLHHHENLDGTGYPSSLRGDEIGVLGQVLSLADTVVALRVRRFAGSGRNIRDAQSLLQIDADVWRSDVLDAAVRVLERSGVERTTFHAHESREALVHAVQRRARALLVCRGLLEDMPNLVPIDGKKIMPQVLTRFIERLEHVLVRSGLADAETAKWVGLVVEGKEPASLGALTELDLLQREILWQFRRLEANLQALADREGMRARSPLRVMVERMRAFFEQLESERTEFVEPAAEASDVDVEGEAGVDPLAADVA